VKRDIVVLPLNEKDSLVIASDNSGNIGIKEQDAVKVPYDVVSYYSVRVALMECMSAGAEPISIVIHNFCSEDAWAKLMNGVEKGLAEIGKKGIPVTGSTESNFPLLQSALGTIVIGKRDRTLQENAISLEKMKWAVIGRPLVGEEVLIYSEDVVPLSLFGEICRLDGTVILPVGSKGVFYELKTMIGDNSILVDHLQCDLDIVKSSGPSTCMLIGFSPELEEVLKQKAGHLYYPLTILSHF
jgi:hypothetical protein